MTSRARALLATLSPVALSAVPPGAFGHFPSFPTLISLGSAVALLLAAAASTAIGRWLAVVGLVAAGVSFHKALLDSPALGLASVLVITALVHGVFRWEPREAPRRETALGSSLGTLLFFLGHVLIGGGVEGKWLLSASLFTTLCFSAFAFSGPAHAQVRSLARLADFAIWFACALVLVLTVLGWTPIDAIGGAGLTLLWVAIRHVPNQGTRAWNFIAEHPDRLLVVTFAALCVSGTVLLALPRSVTGPIALIDAAFTAVSAACVTGLSVIDITTRLTNFGQCVLLSLIQVGGLGIMTLSTVVYSWIGRRMSLRQELAAEAILGVEGRGAVVTATRRILGFTAICEGGGALILCAAFVLQGDELGSAAFRGLFTAISAFCNAGFALQPDSLIAYNESPVVLHTVAVLIILGGLSPVSVLAIPMLLRPRGRPLRLRHALPLSVSAMLLVGGMLVILAFEWSRTLGQFDWIDRVHNAWFQAVTLRTAGFNSVDFAAMGAATLTFCLVLMFIGGSPGGTAGGVKTTTFALMGLGILRAVRGQEAIVVFKRTVSENSVRRAAVVFMLMMMMTISAILALQLTQVMPPEVAAFEVVSALATVGLTIGGTPALDDVGKIIIMCCMFVGRVGGLSLLMFLSTRRSQRRLERPEEEVDVG